MADAVRVVPSAHVKRLLLREVQGIEVHAQRKAQAAGHGLDDDLALVRTRLHVDRMEGEPHLAGHARGHGDRVQTVLVGGDLGQGRRHRVPSPGVGPGHLVNGRVLRVVTPGKPAQTEGHLRRFVTAVADIERRRPVLPAHQVDLDGQLGRGVRHADEGHRVPQVRAPEHERLQAPGAPQPRLRPKHPSMPGIQGQHGLEVIPEVRGRPHLPFHGGQLGQHVTTASAAGYPLLPPPSSGTRCRASAASGSPSGWRARPRTPSHPKWRDRAEGSFTHSGSPA